jgi:simple sugar transport system ATP-binding protein
MRGSERAPILEMRYVTKRFPGVTANDRIDFDLRPGEVHCVLGENGAGKTTLMNILYGLYQMDEGEVLLNGKKVSIGSPRDAVELGIGMIHQYSTLVPVLSVLENVMLGSEPTKGAFIDRERAEKEILGLQDRFKLHVELGERPERLSASERQKVEILKALYRGAEILIMDEPTSVLAPQEKEELMRSLREMARGRLMSIIFITHKLPEALAIADRITILRRGTVVETLDAEGVDVRILARKMVGKDLLFDLTKGVTEKGEAVLEVRELEAIGDNGSPGLRGVSLEVREGEILGVAGVSGNGQEELVEVIVGLRRAEAGSVHIVKGDIGGLTPREIRSLGVSYIPEDRLGRAILRDSSIGENLVLGVHGEKQFIDGGPIPFKNDWFTNRRRVEGYARRLVDEYGIDAPSLNTEARKMSGGNLQKLVLARELSREPAILIAEKPTSGLDVASQEFVRLRLLEQRGRGGAILLVSEDLDEIMMMSDRVAVMYEGRIVGVVDAGSSTKEEIGAMMTGAGNASRS